MIADRLKIPFHLLAIKNKRYNIRNGRYKPPTRKSIMLNRVAIKSRVAQYNVISNCIIQYKDTQNRDNKDDKSMDIGISTESAGKDSYRW